MTTGTLARPGNRSLTLSGWSEHDVVVAGSSRCLEQKGKDS